MRNKNPYILGIIISAPFILWAILLILPTLMTGPLYLCLTIPLTIKHTYFLWE